jgi:hypothetical protein
MNSKRMRFGLLVLAVYAVLGAVAIAGQSSSNDASAPDLAAIVTAAGASATQAGSNGGGDASVEWHSFLPGAFK